MLNLTWLVIAFPIAGVIINASLGRRLGERGVSYVGPGAVGLSFLTSLGVFLSLLGLPAEERVFEQVLFTWIPVGDFLIKAALLVDPLSTLMILVVTGVGFLIHVYSIGYMHDDARYSRFFTYMNLFLAAMLLLVLANNFFVMFVGWELVGLCSYLLIGFWFQRESAQRAGNKAFITTRIGDAGFALGMFLIWTTFGTLTFHEVFERAPAEFSAGDPIITAITLLLFVGAAGKSAQIPLYVWLPDAMEGPTPVSALIHAATMVTAGVYMVARTHVLYELAPLSANVVAVIGAATAFFAATIALVNNDIKRVLAYSTISQLGYMFMAVGVGAYVAGIFHLTTHAFFKALLFLSAGSVMHALEDETDMQKMGGLYPHLKTTALTFMAGWLAISGIPPLSGFFSKDEILFEAFKEGHLVLWAVGVFTAFLTAFYASRQIFLTFFGESRLEPELEARVHESPRVMTVPLMALGVLAIVGGFLGVPPGAGSAVHRFLGPVFESGAHGAEAAAAAEGGVLQWGLALLSAMAGALGILLAASMYIRRRIDPAELTERFRPIYTVLYNKYWVDELYGFIFVGGYRAFSRLLDTVVDAVVVHDRLFVRPFRAGTDLLSGPFDLGVVDGAVNGIADLIDRSSQTLRRVQTGYVRNYALSVLFGVVLVLVYFLLV